MGKRKMLNGAVRARVQAEMEDSMDEELVHQPTIGNDLESSPYD